MAQQGLKIGQEGLKVVILTKQRTVFFLQKGNFFLVQLALEPARLFGACYCAAGDYATGIGCWTGSKVT